MIRAKVIGATGYGGVGMVELLLQHPDVEITCLAAKADVGKRMSEVYPHLLGHCDMPIVDADAADSRGPADVVFLATPDGVGMVRAPAELAAGAKVIDYSGDFRFNSAEAYAEYARRIGRDPVHASPDQLPAAVYGVAELHREAIRGARLVGNPGCFAVSCLLGLAPAMKNRLIEPASAICDCKTGVSGAGKKLSATFHFPARYENMNAYRLSGHQHVCEVERELSLVGGTPVAVTFTAQVVPVCRGIMSTLYGDLVPGVDAAVLLEAYRAFYAREPFVRVFDRSASVGSMDVSGTNRCNLVVDADMRTGKLRVVSYIDNLMKGQAGSALQNMNILFGLPETRGLDRPGRYP